MKGKLYKRFIRGIKGLFPDTYYYVFFPGDTMESSLIEYDENTDKVTLISGVDDFEPPTDAVYYSDGSASWFEKA